MTVIQPMSPIAQAIKDGTHVDAKPEQFKKKYPIDDLQPGTCFTLPKAEANVKSLKTLASKRSVNGKVFKVIVHDNPAVVEFARIE